MTASSHLSHFTGILRNRNFLLLWIGQIISQLGDRLDQMALIAFVYTRASGSTIETAKILSFTILPVFLVGPIAGVYVDRWDRRRTMFVCDFLRALLVLMIPLFLFYAKSFVPIYAIIFLVFCVGRFFVTAKLAIIPDMVDKNDLLMANSLVNVTGMIASILGFGASGLLVEWLGAKSGFYLDSLSFFISGSLIFLIALKTSTRMDFRCIGREIADVIRMSALKEIGAGVRYFIRTPDIRFTAAVICVLWSALGAIYVVTIVFVQKTLHSATKDLGLLAMVLGIGLFLGSLVYGKLGRRLSQYKTIFVSLILSGFMLMTFAFSIHRYPYFAVAAVCAVALGMAIAPIIIASNTIVHKASDTGMRGKVFSSLEIVMHLAFLICMFISSFLAERYVSHVTILLSVGALFSALGAISLVSHRKMPWLD